MCGLLKLSSSSSMATTGPEAVMTTFSPASCWPNPFDLSFVHGEVRTDGRTLERLTVRAVVPRGDELLLVHSRVNGDLMFPGGGIEAGRATMWRSLASCWRSAVPSCGKWGPAWRDP